MKNLSLPTALASVLLLTAPAVLAAQTTGLATGWTMHEGKADLSAFQTVKLSAAEAISVAEKHSGGKLLDISFASSNGRPAYHVRTFQNNAVWGGSIDANSGQVIGQGTTTPESMLDRAARAEIAELRKAKAALPQSITMAEKQLSGKAIAAGVEDAKGNIVYQMDIVKNGTIHRATVDPMSGQLASHTSS